MGGSGWARRAWTGHGCGGQWCAALSPRLGPQLSSGSLCGCCESGGQGATQGPPQPCPPRSLSQVEGLRATMAQRLVRMLQICAGHVPGVSALNLLSLMRCPENPFQEDL